MNQNIVQRKAVLSDKLNLMDIKLLRSMYDTTQIDRWMNKEIFCRVDVKLNMRGRVNRKVLKCFSISDI